MINRRLLVRFKKSWDRLWYWEKQSNYLDLIANHRKLLKDLNDARKLLEYYRIDYESARELNKVLNMVIESKLKSPPNITYVCKYCTFKGKQYRDFCPGCSKDSTGKKPKDYMIISSTNTDSGK